MPERHVNYSQIASTYDQRYAADAHTNMAGKLLALAQELGSLRILEVACGTGVWLAGLRPIGPGRFGLDLSPDMLLRARQRDAELRLVNGRAEHLPFPDRSFDLVYSINAIHHFDQPESFVGEMRRLLRPGGTVLIIGMDPHSGRDRWYVRDYFDGLYERDLARYPSWGQVVDWLAARDFEKIGLSVMERCQVYWTGREVLSDPLLRKEASSQLSLLTDEEYATGRRRIEMAVAEAEASGQSLLFLTDLTIGMLEGHLRAPVQPGCEGLVRGRREHL